MENTPSKTKAKAYTKPTVIIGIVACLLTAIMFLFPWFTQLGKNYNLFDPELRNESSIYTVLCIIAILMYICAAILFFSDHPKLSLLPSIIGFVIFLIMFMAVDDAVSRSYLAKLTAWPYVQLILGVLAIVMAGVSRKANPKYVKVKVQQ